MKNKTEKIHGLDKVSICTIAELIRVDWGKISPYAAPYLEAMLSLTDITDNYYSDSGRSVVAYFLGNANTWKGPVAREVKAELRRRLKEPAPTPAPKRANMWKPEYIRPFRHD